MKHVALHYAGVNGQLFAPMLANNNFYKGSGFVSLLWSSAAPKWPIEIMDIL